MSRAQIARPAISGDVGVPRAAEFEHAASESLERVRDAPMVAFEEGPSGFLHPTGGFGTVSGRHEPSLDTPRLERIVGHPMKDAGLSNVHGPVQR